MSQVKVLLVQLASFGDCLLVTPIAKQIKEIDYPECHLTWMIGSRYCSVLKNNPYVDEIIEIPISKTEDNFNQRNHIYDHLLAINAHKIFNKIFITDYFKDNYQNWYGTTRSSLFRNYQHKITVNPKPVVFIDELEKKRVQQFLVKYKLERDTFNVLFECSPFSGQSTLTHKKALALATEISSGNKKIRFILSSNHSFCSNNPNIIDGSELSIRENAELANFCSLLVGCSSGISWLCTSNYTKQLPFIQVINPKYMQGRISASMKNDFRYFGFNTNYLIELYNPEDSLLRECIMDVVQKNFEIARKKYDEKDNKIFYNLTFLKESKIKFIEKCFLFISSTGHHSTKCLVKTYKKLKPKWFTPRVYINKISDIKNSKSKY